MAHAPSQSPALVLFLICLPHSPPRILASSPSSAFVVRGPSCVAGREALSQAKEVVLCLYSVGAKEA